MTRLTFNDLSPDTDYAIQLRVHDGDRVSDWSRKFPLHTLSNNTQPAVPSNIVFGFEGSSAVAYWDVVTTDVNGKNTDVVRYEIELVAPDVSITKNTSVPQLTTGTRVSYELTLKQNRSFFGTGQKNINIRIRAVNAEGIKSNWTSSVNSINAAPDAPTNFEATGTNDGIATKWTHSTATDVVRYELHLSTTAGFTPNTGNRVFSGYADAYTYFTMTYQPHYLKLCSVDEFGQKSAYVEATATPTSPFQVDTVAPTVPTGLTAVVARSGATASANLTWSFNAATAGNEDIQAFAIKWRKAGSAFYSLEIVDKALRQLSIPLPEPYSDYEFQIASIDFLANYSPYSSTVTLSNAIPGPPTAVTGLTSKVGMDSITLTWNPSSDDVTNGGFYKVTIATNSGFTTGVLSYETGNTNISVSGLESNVLYYYRVIPRDSTGLDGTATTGSVTTESFPVTPLSDGNPPASSPTPTVVGGIGYLHISWPALTNNDIVTYEVHVSTTTGFTPGVGTKVAEQTGTSVVVEKLTGGGNLVYDTPYFVKLIAKDRDGAAAAGAQGTASLTKVTLVDFPLVPADIGAPTTTQMTTLIGTSRTDAVNDVKNLWGHPSDTTLIDGGDLYTNTVRANSLILSDFNNYVSDSLFTDAGSWSLNSGSSIVPPVGTTPGYIVHNVDVINSNRSSQDASSFAANIGDEFFISGEYYGEASNTGTTTWLPRIQELDASGASLGLRTITGVGSPVVSNTATWTAFEGYSTLTSASANKMRWWAAVSATTLNNKVRVRNLRIQRRSNGKLIVDGSIQANKITAGTYSGGEFIIGAGGILKTAGSEVTITSSGITVTGTGSSINAAALTTGSTITATLGVTGTMTISSSGTIKSTNYNPGVAGFSLSSTGLDIRTGTVAVGTLIGGTISSQTITLGTGGTMVVDSSAVIRSNNWNGSSTGWQLSSTGLTVYGLNARLNAANIDGDTVTGRNLTVSSGGAISSSNYNGTNTGWSLSGTGLQIFNGSVYATYMQTNQLYSIDTDPNTGQRLFSINDSGRAQFSSARILGNTVLGTTSADFVQSGNYSPNSAGWRIDGLGNANFNQGTITGGIFQTNTSNTSCIRINGAGLKSYDASGNNIVTIDATTEFQVRGDTRLLPFTNGSGGSFVVNASVPSTFNGTLTTNNGLTVNGGGGTTLNSGATINNALTVNSGLTITGGLNVVTGDVTLSGTAAQVSVPAIGSGNGSDIGGGSVAGLEYVAAGASGRLWRSNNPPTTASALKLKENVEPLNITAKQVVSLVPYTYNYKKYPGVRSVGFIADQAIDLGLDDWVSKEENGEPYGFSYFNFNVAQQIVLRDHEERISEIEDLKSEVAELKALVQQMMNKK